jgi:ABC-type nitrate/sulfonate/bicarbonate transport system substrate-binding protein
MRRIGKFLCVAATLLLFAAHAQAQTKLVVGDVSPLATSWTALIAQDRGFFAAQKLEVDFVYAGSTASVIQQLVGGSLDIAATSFETAIRAIDNGAQIALFGGIVMVLPYQVMAASTIKTAADMKGKTIMLAYAQNANSVFWRRWLAQGGVKASDVDEVFDGSTTNRYRALVAGGVQAALLTQPFDLVAADNGYHSLVDIGSYAPTFAFTGLAARKSWLDEHGAAARAYLTAITRATAYFYDRAHRQEAIDILARDSKIDPAIAAKNYDYYLTTRPFSTTARIPDASVAGVTEVIAGDLKDPKAGAQKYVDQRYLAE